MKGRQPNGLQEYASQAGGYDGMPTPLKEQVRVALRQAQQGECAYCCAKLNEGRTRIEHFHPRSGGPAGTAACAGEAGVRVGADPQVSWSNLLLCCDGDELDKNPSHCDVSKANTDICAYFRNPSLIGGSSGYQPDLLVTMCQKGYLTVDPVVFSTNTPAAQGVFDRVLQLNGKHLRVRRLQQVNALWNGFVRVARRLQSKRQATAMVQQKLSTGRPTFPQALFLDWLSDGTPRACSASSCGTWPH